MRKTLFKINGHEIIFSKGFFGKECVYVSDRKISRKFCSGGTTHTFYIENEKFQLKSIYKSFGLRNIQFELSKDGNRLDFVTVAMKKQLIAQMIAGLCLGIASYQLVNFLMQYL